MRALRWVTPALMVTGLLLSGCGSGPKPAASSVPGPAATGEPTSPAAGSTPQGFSARVIQVTGADGTTESFCVWMATTPEQQSEGLMSVTSLGGADGMLFRFGTEHTGSFWMRNTLMPLSIGFFDARGTFVSSTDMAPCPAEAEACPLYTAAGPYADALEVAQGDLGRLGAVAGSRLAVTEEPCRPSG